MNSVKGTNQPNYLPLPNRCSDDALIEMAQIVKTFKNAAGEFTALNEVTACFYEGEFVSVVGKSGSGKSTLVNMITGIDHPTSGTVRIGDAYVHALSESDMSIWRGKNLGIVFQFFQLLPTMSLLENVMLPMYLSGQYSPAEREERALSLLKLVGLEGLDDKLPAAVSGGQQQCAAIARALANDPPILIADEPTGNLDSRTAEEIYDLFAGLIDQGKTILMVTHDISLSERTTRTLLISDGELINPWVASALPHLGHSQLLWLTHNLKARQLPAGAIVPDLHSQGDWLILVAGGQLEVLDDRGGHREQPLMRLGAGNALSSLDLQASGIKQLRLRAVGEAVEFLVTEGQELKRWLNETPTNRSILQKVEQVSPLMMAGRVRDGYRGLSV
ncbi:MAG TPA: ABC transporter ATP-binding protein [Anaerolineales bacterium]